jgi:hypothetical protein
MKALELGIPFRASTMKQRSCFECEVVENLPEDRWIYTVVSRTTPRVRRKRYFVTSNTKTSDATIANEFTKLEEKWKKETKAQSSVAAITMHPAYLDIIGMGDKAVPLILRDLKKETSHWFIALRAITKSSPIKPEDAGNLKKMRDAWLKWGKENGFLE